MTSLHMPHIGETDRIRLSWDILEYQKYDKSISWWIIAFFFSDILVAGSIYFFDYLTTALFVMMPVTYILLHRDMPAVLRASITEEGIYIGDRFHSYKNIKKYGIVHNNEISILHLTYAHGFVRHDIIHLMGESPSDIRRAIGQDIYEDTDMDEPFIHFLERKLKI